MHDSSSSFAEVSPVPASHRGQVLTSTNLGVAIGLFALQFVLVVGEALIPAILGGLAATGKLPIGDFGFLPVLVGLGASGVLMWFLAGWALRNPWSTAWIFAKARSAFATRRDTLVSPDEPNAILVEVIPRRNWENRGLHSAEDLGLLLVDSERQELLLEGDHKRYRVPAAAVISCELEIVNPESNQDSRSTPVAVVVVTFQERDGLGERELPLLPRRTVSGQPLGGNYVERAQELHSRIVHGLALEEAALA